MRRLLTVGIALFAVVVVACSDVTTVAPDPTASAQASIDSIVRWTGETVGTGIPPGDECPYSRAAPDSDYRAAMAQDVDCYTPPGCYGYDAYAPPLFWGSWENILTHVNGPRTFSVSASPVGETVLFGEVKYATGGTWAYRQFASSTTFTVGNASASVFVRFYGSPYGTGVTGSICWN